MVGGWCLESINVLHEAPVGNTVALVTRRLLLPLASPLPAGTLTCSFSAGGGLRAEMKTAVRSSRKRETRCCPRRLYRALIAPYSALFFIADKILLFVAICLS